MPFEGGYSGGTGGSGTVTSVGLSSDSGSTSAVTTSGTFAIEGAGGISTSATGLTLTISGAGTLPLVSIDNGDSPYSASTDNHYIICDVSGGDVDIELPTVAAADAGQTWVIIDDGSASTTDVITLDADSTAGTTINGAASYSINTARGAVNLTTDGTVFFVY